MMGSALLLTLQMVQTLPPPTAEVTSPTQWNCGFTRADGAYFWLKGTFPEVPAGWDVNTAMPTLVEGNGPDEFTGELEVKPFSATDGHRRYYVVAPMPDGGHYNMMFLLLPEDTGMATIERYTPGVDGQPGTIRSFANGSCDATFVQHTAGSGGQ